jgi:hypothetical protein
MVNVSKRIKVLGANPKKSEEGIHIFKVLAILRSTAKLR